MQTLETVWYVDLGLRRSLFWLEVERTGQEERPFLRLQPPQQAREWDGFADVVDAADPGDGALQS